MAGEPAAKANSPLKIFAPSAAPHPTGSSVNPNPSSLPSHGSPTSKHDLPAPRALPALPRLPARLPGRVAAAVPAPPRAAAPLRLLLLHRRHRGAGPRGGQLLLRRPRPPPGGPAREIKAAYRRLALAVHPDAAAPQHPAASSAEDFIRVHAAYSTLSDPDKRADYDRRRLLSAAAAVGPRTVALGRSPSFPAHRSRRTWETDQCW
ncbi:unnamed protein product [Miscanthus lutarioriparius]|uniref:J domain-containing protein n=1 Tax=Miscanthus lutarioriparius TaxID=422564 RepID=A0A811MTI5_9POAL|nr:unnamed protein product [Miscanthus lutarioriparius]